MIGIYNILSVQNKNKKKVIKNNRRHLNIDNYQEVVIPLQPDWIVGFVDAEGSFHLSAKNNGPIKPKFSITLNHRDILILQKLKDYFNIGSISISKKNNAAIWTVSGNKDIFILINFFNKHKLRTREPKGSLIWKRALRYPLNDPKRLICKTLLKELRPKEFPTKTPLSVEWLIGFIEGEGCFLVELRSKQDYQRSW